MPKYVLINAEEIEEVEELPLKVTLDIDYAGHANLMVDGVIIAALGRTGKLILPIIKKYRQPKGLLFNEQGEIIIF